MTKTQIPTTNMKRVLNMPTKNPQNKFNKVFFKRLFCFVFALVFLFAGVVAPMKRSMADRNAVETRSIEDTAKVTSLFVAGTCTVIPTSREESLNMHCHSDQQGGIP